MNEALRSGKARSDETRDDDGQRSAELQEDGSLDPDELDGEPAWWDEGSDDEE